MKKISTAAVRTTKNFSQQKLTIGLDLDAAATAKLMVKTRVIEATNNRRDRFMASSLKNKTYRRVKGELVI